MSKLAIFPYDYHFFPLIQYVKNRKDIKISKVFSMVSWGEAGESICDLSCENKTLLQVENIYDEFEASQFDIFMIIESEHSLDEYHLYKSIEIMVKLQKEIWILKILTKEQLEYINILCKKHNTKLKILVQSSDENDIDDEDETLYDISTPIIAVAGIGENTNKMELQLGVRDLLYQDHYHLAWISSREEAILLDGQKFPDFMGDSKISEKRKILMYNHYIKWIEKIIKPDVILIGIPGEIMPDSKKQVGNFGITAFEVLNAINPDYFILSLYCDNISEKYLDELQNIVKYKLNTSVDSFFVSNIMQDAYSLNKAAPVEYVRLDYQKAEEKINQLEYMQTGMYSHNNIKELYAHIIDKLGEYGEYQVL